MKDIVYKWVLKNLVDFGGNKVNLGVVLGSILKEDPSRRSQVPQIRAAILEAAKELETKSQEELRNELSALDPQLLNSSEEKEEVKGPLKALSGAKKGEVVVRIAPSPSGPLHIGHAYGASLNASYASMYGGKFMLRIEDTNPENIYPQAYELIERDAKWLNKGKLDLVVIQSSRLKIYHSHAEKLVEQGDAYVCTCDATAWRELKNDGIACPCREISANEQLERYHKMFSDYAEGEAVLRLKTDITHKNPAMRDFALMRINEHTHPKTGTTERVWPLMVFSVAVDDHELGVTHVLNGKDHYDNGRKEVMIMEKLGWDAPVYKHWGRINFEGFTLSSSKTRHAIEQNQYNGWEDIRLPFLPALRRRGYQADAFKRFAAEIGLSINDKKVSTEEFWKMINSFNRELVDPVANRFFFVQDPVAITISGVRQGTFEMDLHPEFSDRGARTVTVDSEDFLLSKLDLEQLEAGKLHRLIDCCNFEITRDAQGMVSATFISTEYSHYKDAANKGKVIHWLPKSKKNVAVSVLQLDGSLATGLGEEALACVNKGDIVQLERQYFAKVDAITEKGIELWYLHN